MHIQACGLLHIHSVVVLELVVDAGCMLAELIVLEHCIAVEHHSRTTELEAGGLVGVQGGVQVSAGKLEVLVGCMELVEVCELGVVGHGVGRRKLQAGELGFVAHEQAVVDGSLEGQAVGLCKLVLIRK